MTERKPTQSSR